MKKIMLLSAIGALSSLLQAQLQFVPKSVTSVMTFDMGRLSKKMDLNKMGGYKMLRPSDSLEYGYMNELVKRIVGDLKESGVDTKQKMLTFSRNDSMSTMAYLFPVSNSKKMSVVIDNFNKDILFENEKLNRSKDKNVTWYISAKNGLGIGLFNDLCFVMQGPYDYYYRNDDYIYDRAIDSMRNRIDSIRGTQFPDRPEPVDTMPIEYPSDTTASTVEEPVVYDEFNYDDDSLMIAFRAWWEKKRQMEENKWWLTKEQKYRNHISSIYQLSKTKKGAYYTDDNFKNAANEASDVFQWMDFTPYIHQMVSTAGCVSYIDENGEYQRHCDSTAPELTPLGKFMGSLYLGGHGDFNNGNTSMLYDLKMSDSLQKYFNRMLGSNVNKKLFDAIKVPQVASLTSKSFNFPAMVDLYFAGADQWRATRNNSKKGLNTRYNWDDAGFTAMELVYTMMDKSMLYETFTGSAVTAITGTMVVHETYTSWEYDDEGNYVAVTKNADKEYPKFVSVFETGNNANLDKLLKPFIKNNWIIQNGNNYYFQPQMHFNTSFFMVKADGYLIFTNDSMYNNADYLKLPPGLDATRVDAISSKPFYLEMNGQGTRNLISGMTRLSPIVRDKSNNALDALNRVTFTTDGSINKFSINVDFTNKNRCSLIDMMDLIELLYQP